MMLPLKEDIKEYDEFRYIYIYIESVNTDVGLLIGNDNRHILQPLEVVNSEAGHYAIKTHVGWVINCPSKTGSLPRYCKNFLIKTNNRLSHPMCTLCSDLIDSVYDKNSLSRDQARFIDLVSDSIRHCDNSHYEIALPLRNRQLQLPYNRLAAERKDENIENERSKPEPVSPSPSHNTSNAQAQYRQERKSKPSNSPNQISNKVKLKINTEKSKPVFAPPLSWTITSASKSITNHETKLNNDDKADSASASSKKSSRSRGSGVSSGNNENCQRKDDDEETKPATKRKKKTARPPNRQQLSFLRDTDESSTMTEKSSEDNDVKQTFSDHLNKREYKSKFNYV